MTFRLSSNSINNSRGLDPRLIKLRDRALEISSVDFGHPEYAGARTAEIQRILYDNGKSECDGITKISNHQVGGKTRRKKSRALDFFAYVDGKASWKPEHLTLVAIAFFKAAAEQKVKLDWGGFWTKGRKMYGWDCGHIEIVED